MFSAGSPVDVCSDTLETSGHLGRRPVEMSEEDPQPGAPEATAPGSRADPQGVRPGGHSSPPAEPKGLLSLPWEMVTHIASHLPAHCVITVLPKVCHALRDLGRDSTAWQLRARRLIGSRAAFPVGPRENFDWPTACLEMEQLITCWKGQAHLAARRRDSEEEEMERGGGGRGAERAAEEPEDGGRDLEEGAGAAAQQLAYSDGEGAEEDESLRIEGGYQLARLREELEDRLEDLAGDLIERAGPPPEALEGGERLDLREDRAGRGAGGNAGRETGNRRCPGSPGPLPALERTTLPSGHIAQVNSVLLVGGEGKVCATGSRDWNVKLWDLRADPASMLLHTLGGQGHFSTHLGWVWCLAAQGPVLASGGFDSTVRLWDLEDCGAEKGMIRAGAAVLCLACQRDVLLAGTFDKRVSMYDTRAAEPLVKSLRLHGNAVMCLAADDKYIISGSKDCTVAVYDLRADRSLNRLRLNSYLLSMSYSDSEVWGGDNRGMLHSFSMQAGILRSLSQFDVGHSALLTGIHRSPGSLYTCSSDRTVKVHIPCAPPRTLCTLQHTAGVNGLSVEAGVLAVASGDMCVEIWRPTI